MIMFITLCTVSAAQATLRSLLMELKMTTFTLYLASAADGKKLSAYKRIDAETFEVARTKFRRECDMKKISRVGTEILALHSAS